MHGLERAKRLLDRRGIADAVHAVQTAEARAAEARRAHDEAERSVAWWDRALFFHESVDQVEVEALRVLAEHRGREAAIAREVRDVALRECVDELPPLAVLFGIEAVTARVRAIRSLGVAMDRGVAVADELDALAARVQAMWLPSVDLARLAADLFEADVSPAPAPGPIQGDERLVYAPIDHAEAYARAVHALGQQSALPSLRDRAQREAIQVEHIERDVATYAAEVGLWDQFVTSRDAQVLDSAQQRLRGQRQQLMAALEQSHMTVVRAIAAAHPALRIALACRAPAAVLRTRLHHHEHRLAPNGAVIATISAAGRAVVLATLVELRHAVDAAFGGLAERIWPRDAQAPEKKPVDPGPYRAAPRVEEPAEVVKGQSARGRAFFAALEETGVREQLRSAVLHATTLGVVDLAHAQAEAAQTWRDRAIFWGDSPAASAEDQLVARRDWHRHLLWRYAYGGLKLVQNASVEEPFLRIGRAMVRAHVAVMNIHTPSGRTKRPRSCPAIGKEAAQLELENAVQAFCTHFGAVADRQRLVSDVARRISQAGSVPIAMPTGRGTYADIVDMLASQLQSTPFAQGVQDIVDLGPQVQMQKAAAAAHDARVRLIDRFNIFTDSPDEHARDVAKRRAHVAHQRIAQRRLEVKSLFRQATYRHPPTYFADVAVEVAQRVAAIRGLMRRRTVSDDRSGAGMSVQYECEVHGREPARLALTFWTRGVVASFGPFPTSGDLLEQWVAAELR